MTKFKVGDKIECLVKGRGFEEATVMKIYTKQDGKFKGEKMYLFKIPCGTATVPVSAEDNYQIKET